MSKEEKKELKETTYEIETHTDSDFRLPKKLLEKLGFGAHAKLVVEVKSLAPGKSATLVISKAEK
jgi:hypothetical protein